MTPSRSWSTARGRDRCRPRPRSPAPTANWTYRSIRAISCVGQARPRAGRSRPRRRSASGSRCGSKNVIARVAVRPAVIASQNASRVDAAGRDDADAGDRRSSHGRAQARSPAGASVSRATAARCRRDPARACGASGPRWKTMKASSSPSFIRRCLTSIGMNTASPALHRAAARRRGGRSMRPADDVDELLGVRVVVLARSSRPARSWPRP